MTASTPYIAIDAIGQGYETDRVHVCAECGSDRVFADAWVGFNDDSDVRTFDSGSLCEACEDSNALVIEISAEEFAARRGTSE